MNRLKEKTKSAGTITTANQSAQYGRLFDIQNFKKDEVKTMSTNYNREAFVRSLEKLCLLHRGIFAFSEDVTYDVKKAVPEGFDPLMYFYVQTRLHI